MEYDYNILCKPAPIGMGKSTVYLMIKLSTLRVVYFIGDILCPYMTRKHRKMLNETFVRYVGDRVLDSYEERLK